MQFGENILKWFEENSRDLPWRYKPTPYNIWVSEIILQQTQMERGIEYYNKFIEKFPDVYTLAKSHEKEILVLWQGLGYYSRARNMLYAANQIVHDYNGIFPDDYNDLIRLKGIGDYTASAILSIAYEKPYVVADGNVIRLITRLCGIAEPVDNQSTISRIKSFAFDRMMNHQPSLYNQAMMELGALICKPRNPLCDLCPLSQYCFAFKTGSQQMFPVKKVKSESKSRFFHYLVFIDPSGKVLINKRIANDIWKGLWEFPLVEVRNNKVVSTIRLVNNFSFTNGMIIQSEIQFSKKHILTHQIIYATFHIIKLNKRMSDDAKGQIINFSEFESYPVHNLMKWGLNKLLTGIEK